MNTRDQFGNYLLLKKLSEDAFGETFRAGRIGRGTLERIVQLRVYNGQGFDGERIARALQARSALGAALKSANIAQAVDVGQVRGVPYVAYDYSAGRSLAQLLEQAARRSTPMPLDHALLVAERAALALAVAHEIRFGEERVQHGFVTPQMVQVSNEGELKLLGFEASAGLRESANHPLVKQSVGRYLSPETLAGQAATRADDVYSVGAILFEMLTGQTVPMLPAGGLATVIDQAVVAAEGTHLPAELAALLKRTLCPREQRVADVVSWHKTLVKLMADSGQAATTFNLAFFLHSLFRDEIDREAGELEAERSQAAALVAAAAPARAPDPAPATGASAAAAGAPSPVRSSGPIRDESAVLRDEYGLPQKKEGGNKNVMIAAAAGGLVVLGVVGYLLLGGDKTTEPAAPATTAPAQAAPAATAAPAPAPIGMTPEQIQALISQALEQQKKQIEAGQKSSDDQLKALQKQLEDAQRTRTIGPAPTVPLTTPAQVAAEPAAVESRPAAIQAAPAVSEPAPVQEKPEPVQEKPAPVASTPIAPAPAPAQASPAVAGAPRVGDLVTAGPGVTMPRVVRQPPLNYPPVAKRLKKEATVTVRVLVDENGRVSDVQNTGAKAGFGMDEAAASYARNCQFEPAKKAGVRVKVWYDLRVAFKL